MRKTLEGLRAFKFDLWLTHSEIQLEERYISECILSEHCLRVILWYNLTFLLKNESLTRKLLGEQTIINTNVAKKGLLFPLRWIQRTKKRFQHQIYRHVILPKIFMGKSFSWDFYDSLTQFGSGRSDLILFCDEIERKAHQLLLKNSDIRVAQYPTSGLCRCHNGMGKSETILSPLSVFISVNTIPEQYLALYYRDMKTVFAKTGAKKLHLRIHPDETGRWPYQLCDYLKERGMDVELVGSKQPLREIICDYLGVAGFASSSLRDCRAACDNILVIAFVAISKHWVLNPKFVFGKSEGIGWIEANGSYRPEIFTQTKYISPAKKSILEIIKEELAFKNQVKEIA